MRNVRTDAARAMVAATEVRFQASPTKRAADLSLDAGEKLRSLLLLTRMLARTVEAAGVTQREGRFDEARALLGAAIMASRSIAATLADVSRLVEAEEAVRGEIAGAAPARADA